MAQINKPNEYFNTILTAGGAQSITGVGFQPDLVWNKRREDTSDHYINDAVRGATKILFTNQTLAEQTSANFISSFDSDGFTTGSGYWNSGASIVAWNWLAGGTAVSNTDGDITSQVSANQTSGFSIVTYTGNGTSGTQVGHGLGSAPAVVLNKGISLGSAWNMLHQGLTSPSYFLGLNYTDAEINQPNVFSGNAPTSSTFYIGASGYGANNSGATYVAYCFAEKKGFSKFGSYVGNQNSSNGTFVYTGFKPAFILLKRTDGVANWFMFDVKRNTYNTLNNYIWSNSSQAEAVGGTIDFYSNGFKLFTSWTEMNASGGTYIYMAFAENPLVGTNNIPATAR